MGSLTRGKSVQIKRRFALFVARTESAFVCFSCALALVPATFVFHEKTRNQLQDILSVPWGESSREKEGGFAVVPARPE